MPLWILWAALAGGVAMNVWYAVAWMGLPHHHGDFRSPGKDSPLVAALKAAALRPGLYMTPHYGDYPDAMKNPELKERSKAGPNAWFVVMNPGCAMGGKFVFALVMNVIEAFALALLVSWTGCGVGCLGCTVAFAAGVGLLARVGAFFSQANWMQLPWRYAATNVFDGVVAFALAGVVVHLFR